MGKRRFLETSQKRPVVKDLVCNPKWSELHPVGSGKPEKVYVGEYSNEVYHSEQSFWKQCRGWTEKEKINSKGS